MRRDNTKTDAGARLVELNDIALWAIRQLLERARLLGAVQPEHYLLPANLSKHTKAADPLHGRRGFDPTRSQSSWTSAWRALRQAAGLAHYRFYDLRHTFITDAVESAYHSN